MRSDLRIRSVETRILDVPLIRPHGFATTVAEFQSILLVKLSLENGAVGYGEGVVPGGPWWGGESVETMQAIIEKYLKPLVIGKNVNEVSDFIGLAGTIVAKNRFAKAALEIAMYDAWARALGLPLVDLLGGAFRKSIPVTWALGVLPLEEALEEVEEQHEAFGFESFKLKMGSGDPQRDCHRIAELVSSKKDQFGFRIDVNARWGRLEALTFLPLLAEAGVELFEQPTPAHDLGLLTEIRHRCHVPVMADESVCSPADALRVVHAEAADVLAIKTTKVGGLSEAKKVAAIAEAAGLACHAATSLEGPIGTAATLHFSMSTPAINFGSELFGPLLLADSYIQEEFIYEKGEVALPKGTGLGVNPDWTQVEKFTRK
ncbi:chloromuconate cycloisomerase [Corynebacterium poyangense]|uniref:Chloromuconate cycloisomerase n=1 Tax=Corynebacterium poyangense TaxID=2684405 RepID=A0A7H0SQK7_9CORY|nr:muconate/chloromuconate family cycloisomerase [Corynebacterium poyangense]QNQ90832.1 chloromuconate cycloisomerase [Corynebacterium poyangense]